MKLKELQSRMAQALFQPLNRRWRLDSTTRRGASMAREASAFIAPNRRLSAFERLEIYSKSYWFRTLDALWDDFPGLRALLGRRGFRALATAYLSECPSRSYTLRNLGSRLPEWLEAHPQYGLSCPQAAVEMAKLEWADVAAFDGGELPKLSTAEAAGLTPHSKLKLQPHLTLLELNYPVDELRLQVADLEDDGTGTAARDAARKVARRKPRRRYVAVYRYELAVYYRPLERAQYELLRSLGRGATLAAAIAAARRADEDGAVESSLQEWFELWGRLGWLAARN